MESLYDAADDDSATGGPDVTRGIYPTAVAITGAGAVEVAESKISEAARAVIADRAAATEEARAGETAS